MDGLRLEVPPETAAFWCGLMLRCFGDRGSRPAASEVLEEIESEIEGDKLRRATSAASDSNRRQKTRPAPSPTTTVSAKEATDVSKVQNSPVEAAVLQTASEPSPELSQPQDVAKRSGGAAAGAGICGTNMGKLGEPVQGVSSAREENDEEEDPQQTEEDAERMRGGGTPLVRRVSRRLSADSMRLWAGVRGAHIFSGRSPIGADEARWTATGQPSRARRASEESGIFEAIARREAIRQEEELALHAIHGNTYDVDGGSRKGPAGGNSDATRSGGGFHGPASAGDSRAATGEGSDAGSPEPTPVRRVTRRMSAEEVPTGARRRGTEQEASSGATIWGSRFVGSFRSMDAWARTSASKMEVKVLDAVVSGALALANIASDQAEKARQSGAEDGGSANSAAESPTPETSEPQAEEPGLAGSHEREESFRNRDDHQPRTSTEPMQAESGLRTGMQMDANAGNC
eukprot:SAG31_NODE_552_length_14204_cov_14.295356_7_plen_460_part_00